MLLQFFNNILQMLISLEIPAGTVALIGGGLAAAFRLLYWHTLFEILLALAVVFAAANIVQMTMA